MNRQATTAPAAASSANVVRRMKVPSIPRLPAQGASPGTPL
jgi:hypothetical protein